MKKGCFISAVVVFTLIVGIAVYIIKYKGHIFKEFSKNKLMDLAIDDFDNKIKDVKKSVYRDSLQTIVHDFVKRTEKIQFDSAMTRLQDILDEARFLYHDNIIDSTDFSHFKLILNRYERSEKNRN